MKLRKNGSAPVLTQASATFLPTPPQEYWTFPRFEVEGIGVEAYFEVISKTDPPIINGLLKLHDFVEITFVESLLVE